MNTPEEGYTSFLKINEALEAAENNKHINQIKKEQKMNEAINNAQAEAAEAAEVKIDYSSKIVKDLLPQLELLTKKQLNAILTKFMGGYVENILKYKPKEELIEEALKYKIKEFKPKKVTNTKGRKTDANSVRGHFFGIWNEGKTVLKSEIETFLKENKEITNPEEIKKRVSWIVYDFKYYNKNKTLLKQKFENGDVAYLPQDK